MKSTNFLLSAFLLCTVTLLFVHCTKQPIVITTPAAGAKLLAGDTISVQWTQSVANPKLSYNYHLTSSVWEPFTTVIPVSQQEVKVVLPTTWYSDSFQIKVEDNDGAYEPGISGNTAIKFIVLTSPTKGQSFTVGQSVNVTWRVTSSNVSIHVVLSTDGGRSYQEMLTGSVPSNTELSWTIGSEPSGAAFAYPSDSCKIKISNYVEETVFDVSGMFRVH